MNILVPDSWLREHLKTKATAKQIATCLSLCSQSVEKISRVGQDYVYDIEITTNRPDCLSVYGIARELAAILPRFNLQARLNPVPEFSRPIAKVKKSLPLKVTIQKQSFCPRFTALIFDHITVKPSPKLIQERLKKSGIRSLNNVVDISNYLMLELGQPMHTFDYDKIKKAAMILREAKKGEKITTLDGQTRPLPPGAVIIEDGAGRIIDLCGIMGGANSEISQKTKRVLLFIQTYNPQQIRRSCQQMAFRTDAAQRFEKGVDSKGVMPTMKKAVKMFQQLAEARVTGKLIDIYPQPLKPKAVKVSLTKVNQIIGVAIKLQEAREILTSLGFKTKTVGDTISAAVPHWRENDINIPEDLIEEIARIYGYHNLPSQLPEGSLPEGQTNSSFKWEWRIKQALKYWGFIETANYSLVNANLIKKAGFKPKDCLKLSNPLSKDLIYLRPSLLPSLQQVITKNKGREKIKIFEMANVYLPQAKNQLPEESLCLAGLIKGENFLTVKGVVEAILAEMGISTPIFKPVADQRSAEIIFQNKPLGQVGEYANGLAFFDLDFAALVETASEEKKYQPLAKYPAVIEDLTFALPDQTAIGELMEMIKSASSLVAKIELIDSYKNSRTFRLYYQHPKKNLTGQEVKKERKKIIKKLEIKKQVKLKN